MLPAAITDSVIDEVVAELNGLSRSATLELTLGIGRIVVARFYGGDLGVLRERAEKDASLRKLASRAESGELHMSASGLYRAIAIYELTSRLGVSTWKHLGVSHLRAVLGLPPAQQQKLLGTAEDEAWTVEEIERAAKKAHKKAGGEKRGRKPLPAFVKGIGRIAKLLEDGDDSFGELDQVDALDAKEATRLYQAVTGMKLKCEELQVKLAARVPGMT